MENLISEYGLWIVFFFMFTNGFASTPPSEATLAIAGAWASQQGEPLFPYFLAGASGNLLGTFFLYLMGLQSGYNWLVTIKRRSKKSGNIFHAALHKTIPSQEFFAFLTHTLKTKGSIWVGILRCFPMVRSIISLPAGMTQMPVITFLTVSTCGIIIWNAFWVTMGHLFHESWRTYHWPTTAILLSVLFLGCFFMKKNLKEKYRHWVITTKFEK